MDWLRQIWFKLSGLWRGRAREAEMAEEMGAHLDRLIAFIQSGSGHVARGCAPSGAAPVRQPH